MGTRCVVAVCRRPGWLPKAVETMNVTARHSMARGGGEGMVVG